MYQWENNPNFLQRVCVCVGGGGEGIFRSFQNLQFTHLPNN